MKIQKLVLFGIFLLSPYLSRAVSVTYLHSIKNDTYDTLYKAIFTEEDYKILIPAGQTKNLGRWVNIEKCGTLELAPLKGSGDSIYLSYGPEAAGECESVSQVVQVWTGQPLPPSNQKTYFSFCFSKDDAELSLVIDENGKPLVVPVSGATQLSVA